MAQNPPPAALQDVVDQVASNVRVDVAILANLQAEHDLDGAALGADSALVFSARITLTNNGPEIPSVPGWAIYFSSIRRILGSVGGGFSLAPVVGDLHRLTPDDDHAGFAAGQSIELDVAGEYWSLLASDISPRWYVAGMPGIEVQPRVIAATDTEDLASFVGPWPEGIQRRTPTDANVRATPEGRYPRFAARPPVEASAAATRTLPKAISTHALDLPPADLTRGIALAISPDALPDAEVDLLRQAFTDHGVGTGPLPVSAEVDPSLLTEPATAEGGFRLEVRPSGIRVLGYDAAGVRHGLRALLSLIPAGSEEALVIPSVDIDDAPRFGYRGLCLDVARHYISPEAIATVLQQMAALRMNVLHLHLTDDEGWRLEIAGLPELTDIGARRSHGDDEREALLPQLGSGPDDSTTGSGYYSRADYVALVRLAADLGITVIPEVDMPAHSRAAVVAMEGRYRNLIESGASEEVAAEFRLTDPNDSTRLVTIQYYDRLSTLDPFVPGTTAFLRRVLGEVAAMHEEAGQPLRTWHFGGDEAMNVLLGAGFADRSDPDPGPGRGVVDTGALDHPWSGSPSVQAAIIAGELDDAESVPAWFGKHVAHIAAEYGVETLQAWQDGLKHAGPAEEFPIPARVNLWDTMYWGAPQSLAAESARGYEVVVTSPEYLYLDFPPEVHELERGYYWAGRAVDEERIFSFTPENLAQNAEHYPDRDGVPFAASQPPVEGRVAGMSAAVFGELLRSDEILLAQLFPRLAAVAERAWHRATWELPVDPDKTFEYGVSSHTDAQARQEDWAEFAAVVGTRLLPHLDHVGVGYRVPPAGAQIAGGQLQVAAPLPGLVVQWSPDGRDWHDAAGADAAGVALGEGVSGPVQVRTRTADGRRFSRSEALAAGLTQTHLDALARGVEIAVEVLDNHAERHRDAAALGAGNASIFTLAVTLTNSSEAVLPNSGWALHVPSVRRLLAVDGATMTLDHLTGDHHRLTPTPAFGPLAPGETVTILIVGEHCVLQEREIMPNWYLSAEGLLPRVVAATAGSDSSAFTAPISGANLMAHDTDRTEIVTAALRHARNEVILRAAPDDADAVRTRVVPSALRTTVAADADIACAHLHLVECPPEIPAGTRDWWAARAALSGCTFATDPDAAVPPGSLPVRVRIAPDELPADIARPEGYLLTTAADAIDVIGFDAQGVRYALMTLMSLVRMEGDGAHRGPLIPAVRIEDAPRYAHRAFMLDIGRNFRSTGYLRRLVDQLAAYKLSTLHLHLTEDEGWRLEIPGLPELTEVGARRGDTPDERDRLLAQLGSGPDDSTSGSGYLSRDEYIGLVRYAADRGVAILPEINMPGHSRAAVMAMESRYHRMIADGCDEAEASRFRLADPDDQTTIMTVQSYGRHSTLNPALASTRTFAEHVIAQVCAMHAEAGAPLTAWHFGGDEVANILLGSGYSDEDDPQPGTGIIDRKAQDRPWGGSPAARRAVADGLVRDLSWLEVWFAEQVDQTLQAAGVRTLFAWQDGLARAGSAAEFCTDTVADVWVPLTAGITEVLAEFQAKGFPTIGSPPDFLYFDAPYEAHPAELGTTWATRGSDERKVFGYAPDNPPQSAVGAVDRLGEPARLRSEGALQPMYGLEAHLWTEGSRSDEVADTLIFPRLLAAAERAWHRADWELDYQEGTTFGEGYDGPVDRDLVEADFAAFAAVLASRELAKLDAAGVAYRVPPPGVLVDADGAVTISNIYSGLAFQASDDDGATWSDLPVAGAVIAPGEALLVRTLSADRSRHSRPETVRHQDQSTSAQKAEMPGRKNGRISSAGKDGEAGD